MPKKMLSEPPTPKNLTEEGLETFVTSGHGHDTRSEAPNRVALQTMAEPTKRVSVDLPLSLHKRFKMACTATDRSMFGELLILVEHRTEELEKDMRTGSQQD